MKKGFFSKSEGEKNEDGSVEIKDELFKKYQEKNFQTINRIKEVGIPKQGEQLRLITMKSFNTIAFIELVASKEVIESMILVIFAINKEAAKVIVDLKNDGRIKSIDLIVSSVRNAGHKIKSKAVEYLKQNNIPITFVNSHAKISALKTKANAYVIEGSGNFAYNGRIEQYIIDNDSKLFDWTEKWISEMKMLMKDKRDFIQICQAETKI